MKYSRIVILSLVIVMVATVVVSLARIRNIPTTGPTATPTSQQTPTPIPGYVVYTDQANGFTISYPEDWNKIPEESYIEGVLIACSCDTDCGGTVPILNVGQSELSNPTSVQALFEQEKEFLATLEGYTSISEEYLSLDGVDAIKHAYSIIKNQVTVKILEIVLVEDTTAWFTACECALGCWGAYEPSFDIILSSFHLLH
jgi:hypothetical protein